jgi:hypothetical protein
LQTPSLVVGFAFGLEFAYRIPNGKRIGSPLGLDGHQDSMNQPKT